MHLWHLKVLLMKLYTLLIYTFYGLWASPVAQLAKNLPANAGDTKDTGLIPGSGRSPGGGNGNPLQCLCQENPMDSRAWQAADHGVTKSWTWHTFDYVRKLKNLKQHYFRPSYFSSLKKCLSFTIQGTIKKQFLQLERNFANQTLLNDTVLDTCLLTVFD